MKHPFSVRAETLEIFFSHSITAFSALINPLRVAVMVLSSTIDNAAIRSKYTMSEEQSINKESTHARITVDS